MLDASIKTVVGACVKQKVSDNLFNIFYFLSAARKAADVAAVSANLVKSYKPCEIIEVSIIVDDPRLKYLGLLGYFENDQGEKVGSWVLPSEVAASGGETTFNTCNNGAAVMHANAALKHYKQTFRYQVRKSYFTFSPLFFEHPFEIWQ